MIKFDVIAIYTLNDFIRSMMRRERTSAVPVSSPTGFSPKLCTGGKKKYTHSEDICHTGYYHNRHKKNGIDFG